MRKITIFKIQTTVVQLFHLFQCVAYFPCKVSESKCLQRCGPQVSTLFLQQQYRKKGRIHVPVFLLLDPEDSASDNFLSHDILSQCGEKKNFKKKKKKRILSG